MESFVKLHIIIVERGAALPLIIGQYWTEPDKQIFICSLSFSFIVLPNLLVFITVTHIILVA